MPPTLLVMTCPNSYPGLYPRRPSTLTPQGSSLEQYRRPCVTAGTLLNMTGLILIGCSTQNGFNALPAGAVVMGLGGITYHLAQFHISNLFPGKRGLISSLYVAGFTGCGIIFYILYEIYQSLGQTT